MFRYSCNVWISSWSGAGCSKNVASAKKEEDEEDDDVDLFGDDDVILRYLVLIFISHSN